MFTKGKSCVVLLSGGIDSTTLLFYVKERLCAAGIHALSFLYGQKHVRELEMARWQAARAGVLVFREIDLQVMLNVAGSSSALLKDGEAIPDLADIAEKDRIQPSTYVPNRNLVFLSMAAAYAEANGINDIFYGAQSQDSYGYWDCTVDFVERLNSVVSLNRKHKLRIHAPFALWSKKRIVVLGRKLGVDYSHTWSCYRGKNKPCGTCPSCIERLKAMG